MDIISHSLRRAGLMPRNGQQYYQALLFFRSNEFEILALNMSRVFEQVTLFS